MSWTDERTEILKKLWADGLSASQIADELGGMTRNAIIGKAHRLGLPGRAKSPSSSPRPRKARSPAFGKTRTTPFRGTAQLAYEYVEDEPQPELLEIPLGQRKTLLELKENTCRWPVGDPGSDKFFFCGGGCKDVYCPYHFRVAYQLGVERRRNQRPFRD
ncbi:MAG: GcrA family cell cycle regulator [Chthoniobacterales bacterium]